MTLTVLKPKPIRPRLINQKSYWMIYRWGRSCGGNIIPFDRVDEVIILPDVNIDLEQWNIVRQQELQAYQDLVNPAPIKTKNPYIPKSKPPTEIGGCNGRGFGPRH